MEYTIKLFEDGKEIEIESLPSGYVRGLIEHFKSELVSRGKEERLWTNFANETLSQCVKSSECVDIDNALGEAEKIADNLLKREQRR